MRQTMEDRTVLDRISALRGAEREHFKAVIEALLECYGKSDSAKAVLVYQPRGYTAAGLLMLGCNEFEATGLLQHAVELMGAVHVADAPPEGMLN